MASGQPALQLGRPRGKVLLMSRLNVSCSSLHPLPRVLLGSHTLLCIYYPAVTLCSFGKQNKEGLIVTLMLNRSAWLITTFCL